MTRSQATALSVLVMQAVIAYLLSQQDVIVPPPVKVALGAIAIGLNVVCLVLRIQPAPPALEVPKGDQKVGP